ncbi:hypothetical protein ANCCAN_11117, partial [Ancylostoma caninum]
HHGTKVSSGEFYALICRHRVVKSSAGYPEFFFCLGLLQDCSRLVFRFINRPQPPLTPQQQLESILVLLRVIVDVSRSESFGMSPTATAESGDSFDEYHKKSLLASMLRSQGDIAATTPQPLYCSLIDLDDECNNSDGTIHSNDSRLKRVVAVEASPLPARNKPPLLAKLHSGDNEASRL